MDVLSQIKKRERQQQKEEGRTEAGENGNFITGSSWGIRSREIDATFYRPLPLSYEITAGGRRK
jgi:hypothetical protein